MEALVGVRVGLVRRMAGKRAPDPRTHTSGPLEDSQSLYAPFRQRKQLGYINDGIRLRCNPIFGNRLL